MMSITEMNYSYHVTPGRRPLSPVTPTAAHATSDIISDANATAVPVNERAQMRAEFFRTYDVMTGVRIAATLGGFFGLMVLLVIYKSLCKPKSLSDEHLNAAAAAVVEEEDNEIAASLEAAAYFSANPRCGGRLSLGNMSAPAMVLTRGARFSSVGGYTSLEPPACFYYQQRGKSLPGSALRFTQQESYCEDDELDSPPPLAMPDHAEEDLAGPSYYHQYLTVPSHSRRLSSITCSSADTSYLERKGSACELGLPPPPPFSYKVHEQRVIQEPWDFYYPIDIQVIQPTPTISPCGSERTLYDEPIRIKPAVERSPGSIAESISSITKKRLAPLASISYGPTAALSDFPDGEPRSLGSDSVFFDNDLDVDTEDEVEGFATDSDDDYDHSKCRRHSHLDNSDTDSLPYSNHFLQVPFRACPQASAGSRWGDSRTQRRRLSVPATHRHHPAPQRKTSRCMSISVPDPTLFVVDKEIRDVPSCSHSYERLERVGDSSPKKNTLVRPPHPLPSDADVSITVNSATSMPSTFPSDEHQLQCFTLSNRAGSCDGNMDKVIDENGSGLLGTGSHGSWSQETLF